MTPANRTLVIIRHAKAEAVASQDDRRELSRRGRDEATGLGHWLAEQGLVPDVALVSSSARTRQTWEGVAAAGGWDLAADYEDALYTAGSEAALAVLGGVSDNVRTVFLIGHNPTVGYLAQALSDGDPDVEAFSLLARGFPPAAAAVFGVPVSWADVVPAGLRLMSAWSPES